MLRTLLAVAALLVGACNVGPAATPAPTAGPATVSLSSAGYFVGPTGLTLYTFDNDSLGDSSCAGDCAGNWPPLTVASTPEITVGPGLDLAEFTAIPRDDGAQQVTYKLIPLYYFAGDSAAGDTNGDGVGDVWHLATPTSTLPSPAPSVEATPEVTPEATPAASPSCDPAFYDCEDKYTPRPTAAATPEVSPEVTPVPSGDPLLVNLSEDGTYLVDGLGLSLYTFDNDTEDNVSTCVDDCAGNWPPLLLLPGFTPVPGEGVDGVLATFERPDATVQISYDGKPLYYYSGDAEAGETNGDGVGDVWHLADPAPETPPV